MLTLAEQASRLSTSRNYTLIGSCASHFYYAFVFLLYLLLMNYPPRLSWIILSSFFQLSFCFVLQRNLTSCEFSHWFRRFLSAPSAKFVFPIDCSDFFASLKTKRKINYKRWSNSFCSKRRCSLVSLRSPLTINRGFLYVYEKRKSAEIYRISEGTNVTGKY